MSVMPTDRSTAAPPGEELPVNSSLSSALTDLPLLDPPVDGWVRLRASLELGAKQVEQTILAPTRRPPPPSQSRWRFKRRPRLVAVAAAATLAALILGVPDAWKAPPASLPDSAVAGTDTTGRMPATVAPVVAGEDSPQAEALMIESARLQSVLGGSAASGRDAETLAIEIALVDRMQWIDYLLVDPEATAATREVLWRQRVELLTQRVALTQRDSLIAASDAATREVTL